MHIGQHKNMKISTTSIAYSNKCLELNPNFLIKDITIKSCDEDIWFLAPTWELVEKYKSGQISEEQFTHVYLDLIIFRWDVLLPSKINNLMKQNVILVCYCPPGQFCHRRLAAEFLVSKGGEYIGEFKEKEVKKDFNENSDSKNWQRS